MRTRTCRFAAAGSLPKGAGEWATWLGKAISHGRSCHRSAHQFRSSTRYRTRALRMLLLWTGSEVAVRQPSHSVRQGIAHGRANSSIYRKSRRTVLPVLGAHAVSSVKTLFARAASDEPQQGHHGSTFLYRTF